MKQSQQTGVPNIPLQRYKLIILSSKDIKNNQQKKSKCDKMITLLYVIKLEYIFYNFNLLNHSLQLWHNI